MIVGRYGIGPFNGRVKQGTRGRVGFWGLETSPASKVVY